MRRRFAVSLVLAAFACIAAVRTAEYLDAQSRVVPVLVRTPTVTLTVWERPRLDWWWPWDLFRRRWPSARPGRDQVMA